MSVWKNFTPIECAGRIRKWPRKRPFEFLADLSPAPRCRPCCKRNAMALSLARIIHQSG